MKTRREILRSATAVAALGMVGVAPAALAAGGDDPIYAAILAHRESGLALARTCYEEPSFKAPNARTPEWEADLETWRASQVAAGDAEFDAQWAMLDVEPTTVAGVLAFLDYLTEKAVKGSDGYHDWFDRAAEPGEDARYRVAFEHDATRFVSQSLKRLLSVPT